MPGLLSFFKSRKLVGFCRIIFLFMKCIILIDLWWWIIFFFYKFIYLFIFGYIGSSLLHVGPLQLRRVGATPYDNPDILFLALYLILSENILSGVFRFKFISLKNYKFSAYFSNYCIKVVLFFKNQLDIFPTLSVKYFV